MTDLPQRHADIRPSWLATHKEEPLDPDQLIIDAHHHLFDRPGWRYLLDDFLADIEAGHDIRATVYIQARAMLRRSGPDAMKPVGETEFANGVAAMCESGTYGNVRVGAGIVGFADLRKGESIRRVLEAHLAASGGPMTEGGRFRGVRQVATWDEDQTLTNQAYDQTGEMLDDASFQAGFAQLAPLGLSFDAWVFFHQLPQVTRLARAFPDTPIVLNHCGGVVGTGRYRGKRDEVFSVWSAAIRELSECPNVMVKLGGLGMELSGFQLNAGPKAPTSTELAKAWRPWMEPVMATFGTDRCMFESNFPMDKGNHSYFVGWNAMKRIASNLSEEEKDDLFWRSAARHYRLFGSWT